MPGFYGWMSDSVRKASSFSDSQVEANKTSSKISGKSGEYLYVFVRSTRWQFFHSPVKTVIILNQRLSNCEVRELKGRHRRRGKEIA